ncbi:MAG TPA: hypothetical protein P5248_07955, partial [Bacteroidales bacterium]|nr:hypothetical protein [Bacteroidales bacterium]
LEMRVQVQGSIAEGVIQAGEFLELSDPMGRIDTELKLRLPRLSTKADAGLELVAWPNPFREETRLNFSLPEEGQVSMILVNALGESIVILDEARMSAGPHSLSLLPGTAPGVYLCRLEFRAGQEIRHHTLRLIRAL